MILFDQARPGVRTRVHYDDVEKKYHHEHIGDCEPSIEANKAVYNGHGGWASDRTGEKAGFRKVAHIPAVMMIELWNRGIDVLDDAPENQRRLKQVLNSNEYRHFRTTPGVV